MAPEHGQCQSVVCLILCTMCAAQDSFPGKDWVLEKRPEKFGYSSEKLAEAKKFADPIDTAAVMVIVNGKLIYQWGDVSKKYITHSTRKSFMSALYGKYVLDGTIDLDRTMQDLGIDDEPPLTDQFGTLLKKILDAELD
ncbi:MAG: hypothetical protein WBB73_07900 [Candidatus Aminicenantaceae bacterium]